MGEEARELRPAPAVTAWLSHDTAPEQAIELSLAALLEGLSAGREVLDEAFAREVAARLSARAAYLALLPAERFGLEDVVVTFHMERSMRLVVTGHDPASGAEVTLRWRERDFEQVIFRVQRVAGEARYTFATLDFSVRGQRGILRRAIGRAEAGDGVTVRCLATLGEATHYRCTVGGEDLAVAPEDLTLLG